MSIFKPQEEPGCCPTNTLEHGKQSPATSPYCRTLWKSISLKQWGLKCCYAPETVYPLQAHTPHTGAWRCCCVFPGWPLQTLQEQLQAACSRWGCAHCGDHEGLGFRNQEGCHNHTQEENSSEAHNLRPALWLGISLPWQAPWACAYTMGLL